MTTTSRTPSGRLRLLAIPVSALLGLGGLAACGDSAGPDRGEVTTEDLQSLEEDVAAMDDRLGDLEAGAEDAVGAGDEAAVDGGLWDDGESLIGQQGTVSAAVSEVVVSSDMGIAFMIGGDNGEEIAVITANPPAGLEVDDVVQVSGTVQRIHRDTFEEDFGVAEDDLFDDADGFFDDVEGSIAISADRVEVLQEQAED